MAKVLFTGAHPDDIESGTGGCMARLKDKGYEVHGLSFTDGQIGYYDKSKTPEEVGVMRRNEMIAASEVIGYIPHFEGHMDGSLFAGISETESFLSLLRKISPDMVFAHWPVDTHPDHRAAGSIALAAWLKYKGGGERFYYYEVLTGRQTHCFHPMAYVDIRKYEALKFKAYLCHASQRLSTDFHCSQHLKRGAEIGRDCCEAYIPFTGTGTPGMIFE